MPQIKVYIKNLDEIKRAFGKAPKLTLKYINAAIQLSIFKIEGDSKRQTPVDTGYLRASHQTMFRNLYGEIGPKAYYAIYVHQGTYKMKARPFLYNAVMSNEKYIEDQFTQGMQKVFDQIGSEV